MRKYKNQVETAFVSSDKEKKYLNPIRRYHVYIPSEQVWNFWPGSICASKNSVNVILLVTAVGIGQSSGTQWDTKVCEADTGHEQEQICFFLLYDSTGNSAKIVSLMLNGARESKYKKVAFWLGRRINVFSSYWAISQRYERLTHIFTQIWKKLHFAGFLHYFTTTCTKTNWSIFL